MALFTHKSAPLRLEPATPGEGREVPVRREELVVATAPFSQQAEQFRRLRNSLQALNPDGAARTILMTSAMNGEGKSIATINLAMALAELPQLRVLVIDANLRDPSVEVYMGLPRRLGFSEVLRSKLTLDQAIRTTSVDRMDIMGVGETPDNLAEVLNVDRIRAVLNSLKRRYDYIMIDCPAVLAMNHPSVVGAVSDGIILVVRLGMTPKYLVEEAYNILENLGGNVLGTCVMGSDEPDRASS